MSAIPIKSSSNVRSTTELTRGGQPEELKVRATTADSSNPNSSFKRGGRDQPVVSASVASTSVSSSRGKTASWIVNKEWRLGEKIGSGSFGEVFQGMNNKVILF
jgi:hypothetical protein